MAKTCLFAAVVIGAVAVTQPGRAAADSHANMLYCQYGSVGLRPDPLPPDYETEFAEAVVAIDSEHAMKNLSVSGFDLIDSSGSANKMKRVVSVMTFNEPFKSGEGIAAYFSNVTPGKTVPWNGTLPAGVIRIRVRVAFATQRYINAIPGRCRVTIGPYTIDGPTNSEWPT